MNNNDNLSETDRNRESLMKTIGLINDNQFDLEEASSQYNRDGMQPTNMNANVSNNEQGANHNMMNNNPAPVQISTPQQNVSYQKEYMDLLSEFSKFRSEVKDVISGFNQNIYDLRSEISELRNMMASSQQRSNAVNYNQTQQVQSHDNGFVQNQMIPNQSVQASIQNNNSQNNFQSNFVQQSSGSSFQQTHQAVAQESNQVSHPRSGGYTPDDVKIENIFYYGNK